MKWYFTFGQQHEHPKTGERMKDYWVEIEASSREMAYNHMVAYYGLTWSMQYDEDKFKSEWFPRGCYEVIGNETYISIL